ncbi:MAG: hypothetical protein ABI200_02110 [Gaiellales bacterium]
MRDVTELRDHFNHDDHQARRDDEHDQVGTVEVQILLSWFFEGSTPGEVSVDLPRAA